MKTDIYVNEKGLYEELFSSQQPLAKSFRKNYCIVMSPHLRQQLVNKIQEEHRQAIEENKAALRLLNNDQQDCDNQIQAM